MKKYYHCGCTKFVTQTYISTTGKVCCTDCFNPISNKKEMIKKEDYLKAEETVRRYKEQTNAELVYKRTCCVCKTKVIEPIGPETLNPLKQEQGMWNDGVVEKITFGYGSSNDMSSYYIAMCDNCLNDLEEKGFATNLRSISSEMRKKGC